MTEKVEKTDGRSFRFGPFQLQFAARILEKSGRRVTIGDRAFDILSVLIRHNNDVVTVADIKREVWRDVHVEDGVIRVHISALRKVLGSDIIKNVAGRGYCFSGAVSAPESNAAVADVFYRDKLTRPPNFPLRLIGRDTVLEQVISRLRDKRFVTIVGPGGVGKTTLSLVASRHLNEEFDGEICFVDLSPLNDAALVTATIASSLGLSVSSSDPGVNLLKFARDKTLLIVIDNCEHVIEGAAPILEQLFAAAPDIRILTTSREPLRVTGEHLVRVGPLETPPPELSAKIADASRFSAMELFIERASAAGLADPLTDEDANLIGDICRKVDGLPLAIELAAARCDTYDLSGLRAALDDRVKLLWKGRRTAPSRHQTLDALIDWSFTLLQPSERSILAAISNFQGAFRIRAAEAVAGPLCEGGDFKAAFQHLVTSSLVTTDNTGTEPRYRLLDATRAYASLKLEEAVFRLDTKQRYLEYLLKVVREADDAWRDQSPDAWIASHGAYIYDVRSALTWAFSDAATQADALTGIRLTAHSSTIWFQLSLTNEYLNRLLTALAALDKHKDQLRAERMLICTALGYVIWHTTGRPSEMIRYFGEASLIAEELQDTPGRLLALWGLWRATSISGNEPKALEIAEQHAALINPVENPHDYLTNLRMKALSLHWLGEQRKAAALATEMRAKQPKISSGWPGILLDAKVTADTLTSRVYWLQGRPSRALSLAEDAADYALEKKHILSYCYSLVTGVCPVSFWIGDFERVRYYAEKLISLTSSYGYPHWGSFAAHYLRALDYLSGDQSAVNYSTDNRAHRNPFISELLSTVCPEILSEEEFEQIQGDDTRWFAPEMIRLQADKLPDIVEREAALNRSLELARHQGALSWELRTTVSKTRLLSNLGRCAEAQDILSDILSRFEEGHDTRDLVQAGELLNSL